MRRRDPRGVAEIGEKALGNANPKYRDERIRCHEMLCRAYRLLKDTKRAEHHRAQAKTLNARGGAAQ
jgi:hypothetical protein